jgi:hypothetical protein
LLTDTDKYEILRLHQDGWSLRQISLKLFGRDSAKSTVGDFINRCKLGKETLEFKPKQSGPTITTLDIEVQATAKLGFNMRKDFSTPDHVLTYPYVLTFAYKNLGEDQVIGHRLDQYDTFKKDIHNDFEIIKDLWDVVDKADILVAHNSKFDIGWFKARCIYHGLPMPSPFKQVCTLTACRKYLYLPSNTLDYATRYFDIPYQKRKHEGIILWKRCYMGDETAFGDMLEYNEGDIPTCESLYLKVRPWIADHPNVALYYPQDGTPRCLCCGSQDLISVDKDSTTSVSLFESVQCTHCGKVQRRATAKNTTEQRKSLLRNVAM